MRSPHIFLEAEDWLIWGIFKIENLKIQLLSFEDNIILNFFIKIIWCLRLKVWRSEDSKYAFMCWEPLNITSQKHITFEFSYIIMYVGYTMLWNE